MSTKVNISFHHLETWKIELTARDSDGTVIPLPSGSDVFFRMSSDLDTPVLTFSTLDGCTIVDEDGGRTNIIVTPQDQEDNEIQRRSYLYEIKVVTPDLVSIQAEGKIKVLKSLFEVP